MADKPEQPEPGAPRPDRLPSIFFKEMPKPQQIVRAFDGAGREVDTHTFEPLDKDAPVPPVAPQYPSLEGPGPRVNPVTHEPLEPPTDEQARPGGIRAFNGAGEELDITTAQPLKPPQ